MEAGLAASIKTRLKNVCFMHKGALLPAMLQSSLSRGLIHRSVPKRDGVNTPLGTAFSSQAEVLRRPRRGESQRQAGSLKPLCQATECTHSRHFSAGRP